MLQPKLWRSSSPSLLNELTAESQSSQAKLSISSLIYNGKRLWLERFNRYLPTLTLLHILASSGGVENDRSSSCTLLAAERTDRGLKCFMHTSPKVQSIGGGALFGDGESGDCKGEVVRSFPCQRCQTGTLKLVKSTFNFGLLAIN